MLIEPFLLEVLACPQCHSPLLPDEAAGELVCTQEGLAYPVRDGIPVLLVDEARTTAAGSGSPGSGSPGSGEPLGSDE